MTRRPAALRGGAPPVRDNGAVGDQSGSRAARPLRVLVLSADMGEGHNATARAVEESLRRQWPDSEVIRLDTLRVMGPGVGPLFRRIYVTNVETTPWLYEYFYAALWRMRWFAAASKRFVGSWCGRRLSRRLAGHSPDLIVSTYPLGSAGLEWLRRHRGLSTPVSAWISDFAPHPFWVYRDLDVHYVMHPVSVGPARAADPNATVQVCAPPVVAAFAPGDRAVARKAMGLVSDTFAVLLSCGSLGFGTIERAIDALLEVGDGVQIVVVCGRNEPLRARLVARGEPSEKLLPLGWIDDMPTLTVAADIVMTNAGGATALEAVACGRAVVMFEPIAAHGRANAELMAESGLATLCMNGADIVRTVEDLRTHPDRLAELEARAHEHIDRYVLDDAVRAFATGALELPARQLRPQDAFFLHTETSVVAQQVGGAVLIEGAEDRDVWLLAERLAALPELCRRLVRNGRDGRPEWVATAPRTAQAVAGRDVREVVLPPSEQARVPLPGAGAQADFVAATERFFSAPVDPVQAAVEVEFVRGLAGGRSALLVKAHHALGDGFSVIAAMLGLLDAPPAGRGADATITRGRVPNARTAPERLRHGVAVVRGLWHFARRGAARSTSLNGPMADGSRRWVPIDLPGRDVRRVGRELGVGTADLLVGVVAEALHRLLTARGEPTEGRRLRTMIPRTGRSAATRNAPGNWTVALRADLPVGPMDPRRRVAEVADAMATLVGSGQSEAAGAVMSAMGSMPAPLHRMLSRGVYRSRWFNLIISVMPGHRRATTFAGRPIVGVYPVLPLAHQVGLSIGLMQMGDNLEVGITADASLVPDVVVLGDAVRSAFEDLRAATGARDAGSAHRVDAAEGAAAP